MYNNIFCLVKNNMYHEGIAPHAKPRCMQNEMPKAQKSKVKRCTSGKLFTTLLLLAFDLCPLTVPFTTYSSYSFANANFFLHE